jgi:hypothetical protein
MAEFLSLKDAFDLYQTQYSQVDKLWSYFGTVTLAVLGFSIGSDKATKSIKEAAIIIVGYLMFCVGNFKALLLGQKQLITFAQIAMEVAKAKGIIVESLEPLSTAAVSQFYWCVVAAVCVGIAFITWRRQVERERQME